jgi:hypothetical protein
LEDKTYTPEGKFSIPVFEGDEAAQSDFRSAVVALAGASQEPEPEAGDAPTGNVAWQELCELLQVEDEDVLHAGKAGAEDERLLRLRADPGVESIKRVEQMIKEKDAMLKQKDKTIAQLAGGADRMMLIKEKDLELQSLRDQLLLLRQQAR